MGDSTQYKIDQYILKTYLVNNDGTVKFKNKEDLQDLDISKDTFLSDYFKLEDVPLGTSDNPKLSGIYSGFKKSLFKAIKESLKTLLNGLDFKDCTAAEIKAFLTDIGNTPFSTLSRDKVSLGKSKIFIVFPTSCETAVDNSVVFKWDNIKYPAYSIVNGYKVELSAQEARCPVKIKYGLNRTPSSIDLDQNITNKPVEYYPPKITIGPVQNIPVLLLVAPLTDSEFKTLNDDVYASTRADPNHSGNPFGVKVIDDNLKKLSYPIFGATLSLPEITFIINEKIKINGKEITPKLYQDFRLMDGNAIHHVDSNTTEHIHYNDSTVLTPANDFNVSIDLRKLSVFSFNADRSINYDYEMPVITRVNPTIYSRSGTSALLTNDILTLETWGNALNAAMQLFQGNTLEKSALRKLSLSESVVNIRKVSWDDVLELKSLDIYYTSDGGDILTENSFKGFFKLEDILVGDNSVLNSIIYLNNSLIDLSTVYIGSHSGYIYNSRAVKVYTYFNTTTQKIETIKAEDVVKFTSSTKQGYGINVLTEAEKLVNYLFTIYSYLNNGNPEDLFLYTAFEALKSLVVINKYKGDNIGMRDPGVLEIHRPDIKTELREFGIVKSENLGSINTFLTNYFNGLRAAWCNFNGVYSKTDPLFDAESGCISYLINYKAILKDKNILGDNALTDEDIEKISNSEPVSEFIQKRLDSIDKKNQAIIQSKLETIRENNLRLESSRNHVDCPTYRAELIKNQAARFSSAFGDLGKIDKSNSADKTTRNGIISDGEGGIYNDHSNGATWIDEKIDSPASIRIYTEKAGTKTFEGEQTTYVDCFLLQNVGEVDEEKYSVFQSLNGDTLIQFFGRRPTTVQLSGILYDTKNQQWYNDFKYYYDNYLRGTKAIENNSRIVLVYTDQIIEGYILNMNMQKTSAMNAAVNINFNMIVISHTVMSNDWMNPEDRIVDPKVRQLTDKIEDDMSKMQLSLAGDILSSTGDRLSKIIDTPNGIKIVSAERDWGSLNIKYNLENNSSLSGIQVAFKPKETPSVSMTLPPDIDVADLTSNTVLVENPSIKLSDYALNLKSDPKIRGPINQSEVNNCELALSRIASTSKSA